jgi:Tol biopolymer transport system component
MLISSNLSGVETGTTSVTPVGLSPDNRYVLLETGSMAGAPTALTLRSDVWLLDRSTGTKTLISVNTNGAPSIGRADSATLTPDGRYVAFVSSANDLVLGDTNGITDIFVRDTQLGTTVLASPGATGGTAGSREPFMSADGRYVLFFSAAQGLTPASTPPGDIYLRDTVAGTTLLVSTNGRSFAGASASACNQSVLIPISTDFEKSHIGAIGSVL